jgi:DtxR family transcriptional regulator, Mn-dependent transcriptional regulator
MSITPTMQRYAAEIYRLQDEGPFVGLSNLAEGVGASLQATSRMLGRLKEAGFVAHEPYRGVRLTETGVQIAMPAIRRHRLVEMFLVRVMGFGWDEVHDFADRFELGINDLLEDRIDALAGYPKRCPHGEPIPDKEGMMPQVHDRSLEMVEVGSECLLSRVRIHDPEKLRYLGELGLVPGVPFHLKSRAPFNGPFRIAKEKQEIVLGHDLAVALYVELA